MPIGRHLSVATAQPELLAPAGDWDCLRAAAANGADAVYFGLPAFNARHRATNFTLDELPRVMEFLHERNVRGYVAFNTLIFSDELPDALAAIGAAVAAGVDALIVQDFGLAALLRDAAPGLAVHGSTQMTLTEPAGIEFARSLGIQRVILARELSLVDIERIRSGTDMPLEVFVHGALCVAYSGQCLTSEALGGRSANRGQCAQACRMPYDLLVDGEYRDLGDQAYLLSPQDLAAHELIGDLTRLGVCSLKIEGRLKTSHYVAATTQTYRAAIEAEVAGRAFELSHAGHVDLSQTFSRGFGQGFLGGVNHQVLVPAKFPKSRGVRVGQVVSVSRRGVLVEIDRQHAPDILKPGDGVCFDQGHPEQQEQGGRLFAVRPSGARVELEFEREAVELARLQPGDLVWRTDDPALRKRLENSYARDLVHHRQPVCAVLRGTLGGPLELSFADRTGRTARVDWPGPLEVARIQPLDAAQVREQLSRLGDTRFELAALNVQLPPAAMTPKSVLNDLRRRAAAELARVQDGELTARELRPAALDSHRAAARQLRAPSVPATPQLYVLTRSLEQLEAVLAWRPADLARPAMVYCDFEDVRRYRDAVTLARKAAMPIGLATLRIVKPGEQGLLSQIARCEADAVLVRNLAGLAYFQEHSPSTQLIGDFSLNIANELTAHLFASRGLARLVPSYDLSWEQLVALLGQMDPAWFETVIHQHMPMFHMEHCVFAAVMSEGKDFRDCGRPCDRHRVELRDRVGAKFPLLADTGCRNTVFNSVAQSAAEYVARMLSQGLRHFRIELLRESGDEATTLVDRYSRLLAGQDVGRNTWRQLQVLNQLGVTRGTLGKA